LEAGGVLNQRIEFKKSWKSAYFFVYNVMGNHIEVNANMEQIENINPMIVDVENVRRHTLSICVNGGIG